MRMTHNKHQSAPDRRRRALRRIDYHWRKTWRDWMDKRLPPAPEIRLNHKNIFISPTKAGFSYLGLTLILLLAAINFQNSAIYGLTFLLVSVFVVSILHTFSNLSGVAIASHPSDHVFCGREVLFKSSLSSPKGLAHYGLKLSWQNKSSDYFDVSPEGESIVDLRYQVGPRGYCLPGRVKIESSYPFGLISARTYVDVLHHTIVYPHPIASDQDRSAVLEQNYDGLHEQVGSDDFFSIREYQSGDRIRNIAWQNYAKTNRLSVKQFVDYHDQQRLFDWHKLQGHTEARLSQLTHWVLEAEEKGERYGLLMPDCKIVADQGEHHLKKVLTCLALFGKEKTLASHLANTQADKNIRSSEIASLSAVQDRAANASG